MRIAAAALSAAKGLLPRNNREITEKTGKKVGQPPFLFRVTFVAAPRLLLAPRQRRHDSSAPLLVASGGGARRGSRHIHPVSDRRGHRLRASDHRLGRARPAGHAARGRCALLPASDLVAGAAKVESSKPTSIEWFADSRMPARIRYPEQKVVLINGYTGEVLGPGAVNTRAFLRWNVTTHTTLSVGPAGHWIVSIANVGFVFLMATGAWLWGPRHWHWKALRNSIAIRFDLRGKARDWNWHNALAFWFMAPLAIMAVTGLVLSFGAVNEWWKEFAGGKLLPPSLPVSRIEPPAIANNATGPGAWLQAVKQRYPSWRIDRAERLGSAEQRRTTFAYSSRGHAAASGCRAGRSRSTRRTMRLFRKVVGHAMIRSFAPESLRGSATRAN